MDAKNLLIIMADEHSAKVLGCYGHPLVKTPQLDRLASSGTRFQNAYTNNPICIPARAAFATGRYTHETGYWDNVIAYDGRVPSWAHRLQENGNPVTSIGKLHYRDGEVSSGFDEQIVPMHVYGGGDLHGLIRDVPPARPQSKKLSETIGAGESEFTEYDRDISARAVSWLNQAGRTNFDKPWTLFVSFICPHFPLTAPQRYFDLYDMSEIPLPKPKPERSGRLKEWWDAFEGCYTFDHYFEDNAHRQFALAGYMALCTFIDDQVGAILAALNDAGLSEKTRIAYVSDHGDNLGARGLWGKSTMYEKSVGVPLILSGSDIPKNNVAKTPVSLVDFYPTVLQCAGISDGSGDGEHPGRSLFQTANGPYDPHRVVFSEYHATASKSAQFMLRRGAQKYIHYVDHGEELFDLASDPEELTDLTQASEYAASIAAFRAELNKLLDPNRVDARAKADQQTVVNELGGREAVMAMPVPYATPAPEA